MIAPLFGSITRPLLSPLVSGLRDELFGAFTPRSLFNDGSIGVLYDNNDFVEPTTWRRNLLTYSEQFDNAIHAKINSTISTNTAVAPDGTTTADTLLDNATAGGHSKQAASALSSVGTNYVYSIYAKAATASRVMVYGLNAVGARGVGVDLTNGSTFAVSGITLETSAVVTDVGSGWYRISIPVTPVSTATQALGGVYTVSGTSFSYSGTGTGVYIWGEQLEVGTSVTAYQRITDFNTEFLAAFPNTTMFVDSAGTTPATVNGLVGLQLDNSRNLAIGSEIVPNGTFDSATGWTVPAGWTISAGVATASATGSSLIQSSAPATANTWYKVEFDWTHVSGTLFVRVGAGPAATFNTSGRKVCYLLASGAAGVEFYGGVVSGTLDNVTAKPIAGNHRYQSTTGSKPILRGTPTGGNLVTNGDFASGTGWTLGTGWTISGGKLNATAVTAGVPAAFSGAGIVAGRVYRIQYTISGLTSGAFGVRIGSVVTYVDSAARGANGTYVDYLTATANGGVEFIRRTSDVTGSIDDVDVRDVSAGSVTAPYGLQYDGVDDFLQTSSVNFSATNKLFVCSGLRKLSDSAQALVVGLGNITQSGAFELFAPSAAAGNNFSISANGGTTFVTASAASFQSPALAVVSGVIDFALAAAEIDIRANGTSRATSTGDAGSGNFRADIVYFGRRGGANLPYNGLDFGFCIVGKTLTASQISSTERWMAQRTGVSI